MVHCDRFIKKTESIEMKKETIKEIRLAIVISFFFVAFLLLDYFFSYEVRIFAKFGSAVILFLMFKEFSKK